MGAKNCKKCVFEGLARQLACEVVFLSLLKAILVDFGGIFGGFCGCISGVVETCTLIMRQPEKYCIFQRALHGTRVFALPTNFRKSLTLSMKKLRKSFKKRVRMRSPVRHHFGEHLGSILAPFWYPFGSQNRPQSGFEGVENLIEKVEATKTRKK